MNISIIDGKVVIYLYVVVSYVMMCDFCDDEYIRKGVSLNCVSYY